MLPSVPSWMLTHRHEPHECRVVFAAWRGFDSPLRRHWVPSTCLEGGHAVWWQVEAANRQAALALLPPFVAHRTDAIAVRDVLIP